MSIRITLATLALCAASCWTTLVFGENTARFDAQHFDLVCHLWGRVTSDPRPVSHGNHQADVKSWRFNPRIAVDLEKMQYCDLITCARLGPRNISSLTSAKIILYNGTALSWSIRRSDGWSTERQVDDGKVSLTTGVCRKDSYSGLLWHFESGRVTHGPGR